MSMNIIDKGVTPQNPAEIRRQLVDWAVSIRTEINYEYDKEKRRKVINKINKIKKVINKFSK